MGIKELQQLVYKLDKELPKKTLDGKEVYDFEKAKILPVIVCPTFYNNRLLIAKRSDKVSIGQGKWSVLTGHLDRAVPIREIILEELKEEFGIDEEEVEIIKEKEVIEFQMPKSDVKLIALFVEVYLGRESKIVLDWEHTEYKWITQEEMSNYEFMPQLIPFFYKLEEGFKENNIK